MATLLDSAFIDVSYFEENSGLTITPGSDDETRLIYLINTAVDVLEGICGRKLKARDFSYDPLDSDYDQEYSIFDGPSGINFWFPTYPINSLTTLIISEDTIIPATGYDDNDGYFLYNKSGKLVYYYGFDYGYNQNVKINWNGGYNSNHDEYAELQYLTYQLVKKLWDGNPGDDELISETLDNYKYTKASPKDLAKFFGLPPFVFYNLFKYKRITV
jgi:hypothetical protein